MQSDLLPRKEAAAYAGMTVNFLLDSGEINPVRIGSRLLFRKNELDEWKRNRSERTYELGISEYAKCLDFALAMHYRGYTPVDWGTSRRREAGQTIANWTRGQLGEIAVQRFLKDKFDTIVELDFELHGAIVPHDIIGVVEHGATRPPRLNVAIKATKFRNSYLILGASEVELPARRSDVYVLTRVDLPDDHLMRISKATLSELLKGQTHSRTYLDKVLDFQLVKCEVVGFCNVDELVRVEDKAKLARILGTQNVSGYRYVRTSGQLHSKREEWDTVVNHL